MSHSVIRLKEYADVIYISGKAMSTGKGVKILKKNHKNDVEINKMCDILYP